MKQTLIRESGGNGKQITVNSLRDHGDIYQPFIDSLAASHGVLAIYLFVTAGIWLELRLAHLGFPAKFVTA